jgi:hypothetical protein
VIDIYPGKIGIGQIGAGEVSALQLSRQSGPPQLDQSVAKALVIALK